MIKGFERKIIMVKNTGNPYFEEAYFIVKKNFDLPAQADIVREANLIVQNEVVGLYQSETAHASENKKGIFSKKGKRSNFFWFACGTLCGIILTALLFLWK